jgi:hypothetical protein
MGPTPAVTLPTATSAEGPKSDPFSERLCFGQRLSLTRHESDSTIGTIAVYEGVLVAAGRTRTMLAEPGPWEFTAGAIRAAVGAGQFESLACFVDHVSTFDGGPSLRDLFGAWHHVVYDEALSAARGELHVYRSPDNEVIIAKLDAISADTRGGYAPPDVGISIVCFPDYESAGGGVNRITGFYALESADIVFQPAVATARLTFQGEKRMKEEPQNQSAVEAEAVEVPAPVTSASRDIREPAPTPEEPEEKATGSDAVPAKAAVKSMVIPPAVESAGNEKTGRARDEETAAIVSRLQEQLATAQQVTSSADAWRHAFSAQIIRGMIDASGLPEPVAERLRRRPYATVEEVEFAIQTERALVEALADEFRDKFISNGRRPVMAADMTTEEDRVRDAVNWMFGVEGARIPETMEMRRLDWLWVAVTGDENFNGVYTPDRRKFTMLTALTLPNLALDAMNKLIYARIARLDHYRWFEKLVKVEPNNGTLMDMKYISYGGITNLPTVEDTAAYTALGMVDAKETSSFVKKGGYVPLSRTIIKNSDLMRLQAVPTVLATAAIRTRAAAVANLLTMNSGTGPVMGTDGKALFHTDHGNLANTAFGTDDSAWNAVREEAYQQTELGTEARLAIMPRYALMPIQLYTQALKVFGYGTGSPPEREVLTESRGIYDPRPEIVVVPEWTDATDWAYLVDPELWPVLHMSYSVNPNGGSHPAPELFIANDPTSGLLFSNDVLPIKVRDEWTLGVSSFAGIGKRNVAG